jgi:hypothetical protein
MDEFMKREYHLAESRHDTDYPEAIPGFPESFQKNTSESP